MMRDINRFSEIQLFLSVIEAGSFSAAARMHDMTPSAVGKAITRLETRLGAQFFQRSTRKLRVTEEGQQYAYRAKDILADLNSLENEIGSAQDQGRVSLSTSASYARHILAQILPQFVEQFPNIELNIKIGDTVSDLVEDGIDLAIRAGPLPDSALMARSLGRSSSICVATPELLRKDKVPHARLSYSRSDPMWKSHQQPTLQVDDGEIMAHIISTGTVAGRVAAFTVKKELQDGTLVEIQEDVKRYEDFHIVYVGKADVLPRRVKTTIHYISKFGHVGD